MFVLQVTHTLGTGEDDPQQSYYSLTRVTEVFQDEEVTHALLRWWTGTGWVEVAEKYRAYMSTAVVVKWHLPLEEREALVDSLPAEVRLAYAILDGDPVALDIARDVIRRGY